MLKYKLVFSPCILFFGCDSKCFDWSEVKLSDDVVFYGVILNKCSYILSYLYTVTLYLDWLLQMAIFSLSSLFIMFFLLSESYIHVTSQDSSGKCVRVLSE